MYLSLSALFFMIILNFLSSLLSMVNILQAWYCNMGTRKSDQDENGNQKSGYHHTKCRFCNFIVLQESGGICLAFIIVKCVVSKTSFTPFANLYFRIPRLWLLFRSSLFVAQSVRCLLSAEIQCQRCKQCPLVRYQKDVSLCCC